ncbi:MAG TPA: TOBE domain-containing protein [Terracidiphilus sp.]|nr:TOBE domain-containing protein [Terracidiphilus sp.]
MQLSARNMLAGTVTKVAKGAVNTEVDLTLAEGEKIAAIITNASADALGLGEGKAATVIIKASEVMVGTGMDGAKISARNVLNGTVARVEDGAVNSEVTIELAGGSKVVASITKASVQALGLAAGAKASAVIKASNVMVSV